MAKIGIYGGTFNPVHNTHIEIAMAMKNQFGLDKVIFLIAGDPPHKSTGNKVTAFQRLEMLEIALNGRDGFEIDKRELFRSGKSYSYITLQEYKAEYPNDELYFLMGSDSFINFENWVHPEIISSVVNIVIAPRIGDSFTDIENVLKKYSTHYSGSFELLDYKANEISSSFVRDRFYKSNEEMSEIIPASVFDYIKLHHLYSNFYNYDVATDLAKKMKDELKTGRYVHTLGVASTAYDLALKWNYPAYNAMVAGMLHDCAKCLSDQKRINICQDNNIPIREIEMEFPHLLHGKVGAYLAKTKYDIEDTDILHAIEIHTTGCTNMNLLDKIIFVADYIEPGRDKQPRLDILRKIAFEDLDKCVYMILEDTVNYLNETPDSIDPVTIETFEYYKNTR